MPMIGRTPLSFAMVAGSRCADVSPDQTGPPRRADARLGPAGRRPPRGGQGSPGCCGNASAARRAEGLGAWTASPGAFPVSSTAARYPPGGRSVASRRARPRSPRPRRSRQPGCPDEGALALTHGEVIAVLVANGLCGPAPLYDIALAPLRRRSPSCSGSLRACERRPPWAGPRRYRPSRRRSTLEVAASRDPVGRAGRDEAAPRSQALASRGLRGLGAREERLVGGPEDRPAGEDAPGLHPLGGLGVLVPPRGGDWRVARVHGSDRDPRKDAPSRSRRRRLRARIPREPRSPACRQGLLRRLVAADTSWASASEPRCEAGCRLRRLEARRRTLWTGLLCPFPVAADDSGRHELRVAYIFSSDEALSGVRNGLSGRYYKTDKQVDNRVAVILLEKVAGLIASRPASTRASQPSPGHLTTRRSPRPAHSTVSTQPPRPRGPVSQRSRRAQGLHGLWMPPLMT